MRQFACRILRWIREEEERITNSNERPLKCIILDMAGKWRWSAQNLLEKLQSSVCTLIMSYQIGTAVTNIDISGIESLKELKKTLDRRSLEVTKSPPSSSSSSHPSWPCITCLQKLQLVLANPVGEVSQKLSQSGAWELFGPECFYMTVEEAIASTTYKIWASRTVRWWTLCQLLVIWTLTMAIVSSSELCSEEILKYTNQNKLARREKHVC